MVVCPMADAIALDAPPPSDRLEQFGALALFGVAGLAQFSIAGAQILLTVAIVCWVATVVTSRERVVVPRFFWPLVGYSALTLVSAAFSPEPATSFVDSKQL